MMVVLIADQLIYSSVRLSWRDSARRVVVATHAPRLPITAAVSGGFELLRDEPEKHLKILVRPGGTR